MSFPRYPEYKGSGVEWLGEIPAHWAVRRLKHCMKIMPSNVDKKSYEDEEAIRLCNYTDVYYNEVISDLDFMPATASASQIEKFSLRENDVIITKDSETADDIAVSAFVPRDLPGVVCGYHLALLRGMAEVDGRFVKRLFDSAFIRATVAIRANGLTRVGLGQYDLDNIEVPFPGYEEQQVIAHFIDQEAAKIDELVTEQERLIELLNEKRQATISHAVTKGLNPDASMKDSGIEWLGEIPAHWEIRKMKSVARMDSGHTPDKKIAEYWEGGNVPWVSLNDTAYLKDNDYITDTAQCVTEAGLANSSAHLLPPRAVVFSRDATIGRCAITTRPMAVSQHFIAWICGEMIVPEYLLLRLRSMSQELESLTTGATLKTIGMPEVRTLVTPLPPLDEQYAIIRWSNSQMVRIDALITEAKRAIELLQERRAALISAAVTGKIDVRPAAQRTTR